MHRTFVLCMGFSTLCPGAAVRAARPFLPAAGLSCLEYAPFQTGGADGTQGGRKTGRPRQAGDRKTATPDGVTALWRPEKSSVADPRLNQTATQRKQLRFGKEPQQNERAVTFKKSRRKRCDACGDLVEEGGFEPPKRNATDLQSAPFGHSGTPPYEIVELVDGFEPPTC